MVIQSGSDSFLWVQGGGENQSPLNIKSTPQMIKYIDDLLRTQKDE